MSGAAAADVGIPSSSSSSSHLDLTLPRHVAIQIQSLLSQSTTQNPSNHQASSTSLPSSSWIEQQSVEKQLDQLLSKAQPLNITSIDRVHSHLRQEIQTCQSKIDRMTEEMENQTDPARMSQIQQSISVLLEQLNLIRQKARESEHVVKEITREIRNLDIAKRNVVSSMTALKRLQMLVNGVDQLERLAETKRYKEAASALQAVKSLLDFFQSFRNVERIASTWKQVGDLQNQLRGLVMKDYESFLLHESGRPMRASLLPDGALVMDAIGNDARSSLIDWYCSLQLREYRRIFRATDEAGQLDNVSRRFAWFRRILKSYEDEHAVAFLDSWHVERWLVLRFSEITRDDLKSVLIREQSRFTVATLLEALNAALEFEAAMCRKYSMPFQDIISSLSSPPQPSSIQHEPSLTSKQSTTTATAPPSQTLSSVFDPYLTLFVEAQDKALAEMFVAYRRQGSRPSHDASSGAAPGGFGADGIFGSANGGMTTDSSSTTTSTVLPSSTEMFYFYRQTLEQCARLSNREPFRELCNVYKKWLRIYAEEVLRNTLVRNEPVRRSIDVRPNSAELQKWCLVLNTADYCSTTCSQLEDKLKEKIHTDFKDGISLEEEKEIFLTVISYAVQTLARELELCSETVWNQMLRPSIPWSQQVESESQQQRQKSHYVNELASVLEQVGVVIRQEVENKRYLRSWCDKVVTVIITRFTHTLVKLKPISRVMAEQLLIDIKEIRISLIDLPRYPPPPPQDSNQLVGYWDSSGKTTGSSSDTPQQQQQQPPATSSSTAIISYTKFINRFVSRLETLLKVILSDDPDEIVQTYLGLICDRSFSNFQKILDLKGIRKIDQNRLLDRFLQVINHQQTSSNDSETVHLTDQKFLTQLDMDPPTQPIIPIPFHPTTSSFLDGLNTPPSTTRSSFHSSTTTTTTTTTTNGSSLVDTSGGGGTTSRALSDLKRFGSMFGAALGGSRREDSRAR